MVRNNPEINLVLSDVMMEGTSGYDLLVRCAARRPPAAPRPHDALRSLSHTRPRAALAHTPPKTPRP